MQGTLSDPAGEPAQALMHYLLGRVTMDSSIGVSQDVMFDPGQVWVSLRIEYQCGLKQDLGRSMQVLVLGLILVPLVAMAGGLIVSSWVGTGEKHKVDRGAPVVPQYQAYGQQYATNVSLFLS